MEAPSTLQAYVEAQDELDREARRMFPYEFSCCSVDHNYIKQQVFACVTCMKASGRSSAGGVCYSCSITCHGEHDLIELFDRRAFKCDCGSPIMGDVACNITKSTRTSNIQNKYNDNFKNIFCYCRQEYDPIKEDSTMFQCLLCEDWFHDRCIAAEEPLPEEDSFEHYICRNCAPTVPWLTYYEDHFTLPDDPDKSPAALAEIKTETKKRPFAISDGDNHGHTIVDTEHVNKRIASFESHNDRTGCSTESGKMVDHEPCSWSSCAKKPAFRKSIFLPEDFREHFCQCQSCCQRVEPFPALAQDEEVFNPPEDNGDNESLYDAGTRAMESTLKAMPRESAIEGVLAYNKLREHITACLKPLADKGEIITKDHVKSFFEHR